ncbi:MAG: YtxH domain-containing protein [Candidatus Berkelbacteria bacterium]
MDKKTKGILEGAAIGVIAGAIAGILLAPKSGKETRDDIAKYATEMKDKIAGELAAGGKVTKEKYEEVVAKIVSAYETEKKISIEDAKAIKEILVNNYQEVAKAIKAEEKK